MSRYQRPFIKYVRNDGGGGSKIYGEYAYTFTFTLYIVAIFCVQGRGGSQNRELGTYVLYERPLTFVIKAGNSCLNCGEHSGAHSHCDI